MTVCNRCGKENQDHYKFCLGCGAELTAAPKPGGDMGMMKTMMAESGPTPGVPLGGGLGGPIGPGPMRSQSPSQPIPPMQPAQPMSRGSAGGIPGGMPGM